MEFYRKKIEPYLFKTNYTYVDGKRKLCKNEKYEVVYSNKFLKTRRFFNTLEEARAFNTCCMNMMVKMKYNKSKPISNLKNKDEYKNLKFYEYPDNLLSKLDIEQNEDYYKIVLPYFDINFAKIASYLKERELNYIDLHFKQYQTLEAIGKKEGFTKERIRQIIYSGLKKIEIHKDMFYETEEKMYLLDKEKENELLQEAKQKINKETALEIVKDLIKNKDIEVINDLLSAIKENEVVEVYKLSDLGLSVRTFNCFTRAGFYKYGDIPFDDPKRLLKIRNLGMKSLKEIYDLKDKLEGTEFSYAKALEKLN